MTDTLYTIQTYRSLCITLFGTSQGKRKLTEVDASWFHLFSFSHSLHVLPEVNLATATIHAPGDVMWAVSHGHKAGSLKSAEWTMGKNRLKLVLLIVLFQWWGLIDHNNYQPQIVSSYFTGSSFIRNRHCISLHHWERTSKSRLRTIITHNYTRNFHTSASFMTCCGEEIFFTGEWWHEA